MSQPARDDGTLSAEGTDDLALSTSEQLLKLFVQQLAAGVCVVQVSGELDTLTVPSLKECVREQIDAGLAHLVLNLEGVKFLGSNGVSILLWAREGAEAAGVVLHIAGLVNQAVSRPLEVTETLGLFRTYPTLAALGDCAGRDRAHAVDHSRSAESFLSVRRLREGHRDSAEVMTSSEPSVAAGCDEYAHLVPLQWRYAGLTLNDSGRQRLREQLISGYLPVAMHIARRFAGRGEPLEDLIQVATVGLINAVDRFDPARGSRFLSFAVPTITGEVRRYFRDHGWAMRVPRWQKDLQFAIRRARKELSQQLGRAPRPSEIADWLGLTTSKVIEGLQAGEAYSSASLDEMLDSEDGTATLGDFIGGLDDQLTLIEDREVLRPLLAELTPRQRTVLGLRFFHHWSQAQIAEQVGVSQMEISRVLRKTLEFLHQHIQHMATSD